MTIALKRLALAVVVLLPAGCGGPAVDAEDAGPLAALASYEPCYELDGRGRVVELRLEGRGVSNDALGAVSELRALRGLSLYGSAVTDAGLLKLSTLERLEALGLGRTRVTAAGLRYVARIRGLRWLWLSQGPALPAAAVRGLKKARPGLTVYVQK